MKIQLLYDRPSEIGTDLLVVILDPQTRFHDLRGSPVEEIVRRVAADIEAKRLKKEYFTSVNSRGKTGNLLICSTALNPGYNVWENFKTFVARSIRLAKDYGLGKVAVLLNTNEAVPFVGKAVEGAILGSYSFDRYKKEKPGLDKIQVQLVCLKQHDQQIRHYLNRYT